MELVTFLKKRPQNKMLTQIMKHIWIKMLVGLGLILGTNVGVAYSQNTDPAYARKLNKLYRNSVPLLKPAELKEKMGNEEAEIVLLDTRAPREYEVSHLPNAEFVNYDKFKKSQFADVPRDATVVVYCSVGYRSERIGEKLKKMGFTDVYNLYGGIFEWKNQGNEVVGEDGKPTEAVHTYNEDWGQWLNKGKKVTK